MTDDVDRFNRSSGRSLPDHVQNAVDRAEGKERISVDVLHRLDSRRVEDTTHKIINFIDHLPASEPEKLAALLAAGYAQRHFMLETPSFAGDVALVESFHRETLKELKKGRS